MRMASVMFILAFCMSPSAFAQVNFSGTWVYDRSASTLPHSGEFTIVHSGNRLTMTLRKTEYTSSGEYILDGVERRVETGTQIFHYKAVVEGSVLRITKTFPSESSTRITSEFTYILSDNGQTLTNFTPVFDPRGGPTQIRKLVFRKQ